MTITYSNTVLQNMLDAYEAAIGTAPIIKIYTGTAPAFGAASTGTLLVTITLPSDWMANASAGTKAKTGTWSATAGAAGTAGYYRFYASDGTTLHEQGSVTATGGGGDLTLDNTVIASAQTVTISGWTKTLAAA